MPEVKSDGGVLEEVWRGWVGMVSKDVLAEAAGPGRGDGNFQVGSALGEMEESRENGGVTRAEVAGACLLSCMAWEPL